MMGFVWRKDGKVGCDYVMYVCVWMCCCGGVVLIVVEDEVVSVECWYVV